MSVLSRSRRRSTPPVGVQTLLANPGASRGQQTGRGSAETWTGGPRLATRAATVGLWAAVGAGPAALLVAMAMLLAPAPTSAPPAAAEAAPVESEHQQAVGEFAQRLVVDWLQTPRGEERRLDAYGLPSVSSRQPTAPQQAMNPAVTSSSEVEPGFWSVTVGVTVIDPVVPDDDAAAGEQREEPVDSGQRRYFQVAVEYSNGQLAAQALPAPVPSPPVVASSRPGYRDRATSGDPVFETVDGFLSALLAGAGDIDRYLAPGTVIDPVSPAPFAQVELTEVRVDDTRGTDNPADGDQLHALATATGHLAADQQLTVQYPLTMVARAGRWEITEIAPTLRGATRSPPETTPSTESP